jgi:hypothetical protein
MASVLRQSGFPQSTTLRGIHMVIGRNYTQRPSIGEEIFTVKDSTQYREHTLTMGAGGLFETRDEGQPTNYVTYNEGFLETYTYVTYSSGFRITQVQYLNDLYGTMEDNAAELGRMAVVSKETILANHFNNAFSGSFLGADGASLCSVSHLLEDGTTVRNKPATNSDMDFSTTGLEQGLVDFRDQRDGGNKRLQFMPEVVLTSGGIIGGVFDPQRTLGSTNAPDNDTNAINPVKTYGLSHKIWDYLSNTDDWFILAPKAEHKLLNFIRIPFYSEHLYDFDTDDVKVKGVFGESSGWGDWRGIWGTSGA